MSLRLALSAEAGPTPGQVFHLCIINLVIGTLYCAKGNFEFGIGRVMKARRGRPHCPHPIASEPHIPPHIP